MDIRIMERTDYPEVDRMMQDLHEQHVHARPDLYTPLAHPLEQAAFEKLIRAADQIALLALSEDRAVGLCLVAIRSESGMCRHCTAYMDALYVAEAFRRRGIGRALYVEAVRRAVALGARRLDLMVWHFNEAAFQFYTRLGMTTQRTILEQELTQTLTAGTGPGAAQL